MALIGKKKQSESVDARKTNANGVVITVYVESTTTRTKKTEPHANLRRPIAAGTHGYDRRALLLAYSQHLRNAGSDNVPLITNQPQHKIKSKVCSEIFKYQWWVCNRRIKIGIFVAEGCVVESTGSNLLEWPMRKCTSGIKREQRKWQKIQLEKLSTNFGTTLRIWDSSCFLLYDSVWLWSSLFWFGFDFFDLCVNCVVWWFYFTCRVKWRTCGDSYRARKSRGEEDKGRGWSYVEKPMNRNMLFLLFFNVI